MGEERKQETDVSEGTLQGIVMCFEQLHESAQRGELLLVDGGMCHWHLRRDGQLTIREIIATRQGAGSQMLAELLAVPNVRIILAKCPADLPANEWYGGKGFELAGIERAKSGREINVWILELDSSSMPDLLHQLTLC